MSSSVEPGHLGYDPAARTWGPSSESCVPFVEGLDGTFTIEPDVLREAGRDLGRLREARPAAVLKPGSVADISKVVARCHDLEICVAAQGAAHTVGGQRLAEGGIAIDMTCLDGISDDDFAADLSWVDAPAGMLWSSLALLLIERGVRFAGGLTGYLGLSIGGTLAVGGISAMPAVGAQVDHVLGLEVVIGDGTGLWCSPVENRDLFDAALAGLGQVGIVTKARLQLVPAPPIVASAVVPYVNPADAFAAVRIACAEAGRDDEAFMMIMPPADGAPEILNVHLASYGEAGHGRLENLIDHKIPAWHVRESHDERLEDRQAQRLAGDVQISVLGMRDHLFQFTELIDHWRRNVGWDDRLKPWFDEFLPDAAAEPYVTARLREMDADDWSAPDHMGFVLVFPHRRNAFHCPGLILPDAADPNDHSELVWLFDVLNVSPSSPPNIYETSMAARNSAWRRASRAVGGTRYPIAEMPTAAEWPAEYGDAWPAFAAAKSRYDPRGILTPGPNLLRAAQPRN